MRNMECWQEGCMPLSHFQPDKVFLADSLYARSNDNGCGTLNLIKLSVVVAEGVEYP
jgi:hypothetical protein